MTRQECAEKLIALMEEAGRIYREFNPDGAGISCSCGADGYINVSDINVNSETHEITNWKLEASKYTDGRIVIWDYDGVELTPADTGGNVA